MRTHLCVPEWLGGIDDSITNGDPAGDIADSVGDNLQVMLQVHYNHISNVTCTVYQHIG